jgi:Flp pilus assembly protein TadG
LSPNRYRFGDKGHDKGDERGSVLMLMPAAILVLIVLGAIAVDSAVTFLAQRELMNAAAAAANDAATSALVDRSFYEGGGALVLDRARAEQVAATSIAASQPQGLALQGAPVVNVDGASVCVELTARVHHLFAHAIPGVAHDTTVSARASATAVAAGAVPPSAACP